MGIDAVLQRISQIQQRVASHAPPAQHFEALLAERLESDPPPSPVSQLLAPLAGAPVTIGAFLDPALGPVHSPPPWVGGIAHADELEAYLNRGDIEARNGRLAEEQMARVEGGWGDRRVQLLPPAAAAWTAMRAAAAADGIDLRAVDSYRDWDTQARAHREFLAGNKPANVAPPGLSQHGNGLAVDITNGSIIDRADREWQWLEANAARFGWYPISNETWHWEFRGVGA